MLACTITVGHILHASVGPRPRYGDDPYDVFAANIAAVCNQSLQSYRSTQAPLVKTFGPTIEHGAQESGPLSEERLQAGLIVNSTLLRCSLVDK